MLLKYVIKKESTYNMSTLLINAHPSSVNLDSFTSALKNSFLESYAKNDFEEEINYLNLYNESIPSISDSELTNIWKKQNNGEVLSLEETKIANISDKLLKQFKDSSHIVIVSPLHNFNVPSRLKDYLDNILIAKQTFKYLESGGSVGLMQGHKCLLLQASGCVYSDKNSRYTNMDFSHQYLETMFKNIMNFDEFNIIRAEGTDFLNRKDILDRSNKEIQEYIKIFYNSI